MERGGKRRKYKKIERAKSAKKKFNPAVKKTDKRSVFSEQEGVGTNQKKEKRKFALKKALSRSQNALDVTRMWSTEKAH